MLDFYFLYALINLCISLLLLPITFYIMGSLKIKSFQSLNLIKEDYVVRAIGSKISLNRFYENSDPSIIIEELIKLSEPNLDTKTLFLWPEGIIPNTNQFELKEFKYLFNKSFNNNHILGIGINSHEIKDNKS